MAAVKLNRHEVGSTHASVNDFLVYTLAIALNEPPYLHKLKHGDEMNNIAFYAGPSEMKNCRLNTHNSQINYQQLILKQFESI